MLNKFFTHIIFVFSLLFISSAQPGHFTKEPQQQSQPDIPIVYHQNYNITFGPFTKLINLIHPFDTSKYGKIFDHLTNNMKLKKHRFHSPTCKITDEELLTVHTQEYLDSLKKSSTIARVAEIPVHIIPNKLLQWLLLNSIRWATQGTIQAGLLALEHDWAINLAGGYHHAKESGGQGFCFFADIVLAIKEILKIFPDYNFLIVDLDAHQGNGHESYRRTDQQIKGHVDIFDMYNGWIYPQDNQEKPYITYDVPVNSNITSEHYLTRLKKELPKAFKKKKYDYVIYVAGTDIYEKDRLGNMKVSKQAIIDRDEFVFDQAFATKAQILMLPAGGYTNESHAIVSKSIENLIKKFKLVK
ncbi:MAG: histone deacetylase [bacterium]